MQVCQAEGEKWEEVRVREEEKGVGREGRGVANRRGRERKEGKRTFNQTFMDSHCYKLFWGKYMF